MNEIPYEQLIATIAKSWKLVLCFLCYNLNSA